jgi:phosphoglycerate dehydrogenase-like enzyme
VKCLVAMGRGPDRDSFFTPQAIAELRGLGELSFVDAGRTEGGREAFLRALPGTELLFTGWGSPRVDREALDAAPALSIHAHAGGSVAPFVSREEYERGVVVLTGNEIFARSVAEGCLAYTLVGLRRLSRYGDAVARGGWRPAIEGRSEGLCGKRVGLVGFGAIAEHYSRFLSPFGVELSIASRHVDPAHAAELGARVVGIEELFSECEVVSLHSALNSSTRGMIDSELLGSIPDGALFVNTARAGLVDGAALLREIGTGRFHAVLDVFDEEPLGADSPYRTLSNVTIFPHVAGPTHDVRERVVSALVEDVRRLRGGEGARRAVSWEHALRMTVADPSDSPDRAS